MGIQESLPPSWRTWAMAAFNTLYSLIAAVTALCCRMTQQLDWRLEYVFWCAAPLIIALAIGIPAAGESPSFLANKGRTQEAMAQVMAIATKNGVEESARGFSLKVEAKEGNET